MDQFIEVDSWAELLERMLAEQRPEDIHLDYKDARSLLPIARGGSGVDKQKRREDISKDVSSFLNRPEQHRRRTHSWWSRNRVQTWRN